MLLLELKGMHYFPYRDIYGNEIDPLKEAMKEVVITGVDPMVRGFVKHNGKIYFGHERKFVETEILIKHEDD